jgi:superfamily II DNA/RNA helicase
MLFSATLDNGVKAVVDRFLSSPVVHSVDPEAAVGAAMEHHVFAVTQVEKAGVVRDLASGKERVLLFTRTKHGAAKWAKALTKGGTPAVELHGNLSQNARERNLEMFSSGQSLVLVATDIAARGIHVDDIALVVHVDPPAEHKAYLHRSGRTARAGALGTVVTLMTPDQTQAVSLLAKQAGADACKIQCYTPDSITFDSARDEFIIKDGPWKGRRLYELYSQAHTPRAWFPMLFAKAWQLEIPLFASVFSLEDLDFIEFLLMLGIQHYHRRGNECGGMM